MNTADDTFVEFCRENNLGEVAKSSNTHAKTMQLCERLLPYFTSQSSSSESFLEQHYNSTLRIHMGFCADRSLNAFAACHRPDVYVIGINAGAIATMANLYDTLFLESPRLCRNMTLGALRSKFSRQQILAKVAFFAAMNFLFMHELGHIVYGHTDVLSANGQYETALISEATSDTTSKGPSASLFQSMEVEADLYASSSVIAQIGQGTFGGLDITHFLTSRADVLHVALVALTLMFHQFYGAAVTIDSYRAKTHPLPELRMLKIWVRAQQMREVLPETVIQEDAIIHLIKDITNAVTKNTIDSLFPCLRTESRINMVSEARRVRENEDRHEKQLKKFARLPIGTVIVKPAT